MGNSHRLDLVRVSVEQTEQFFKLMAGNFASCGGGLEVSVLRQGEKNEVWQCANLASGALRQRRCHVAQARVPCRRVGIDHQPVSVQADPDQVRSHIGGQYALQCLAKFKEALGMFVNGEMFLFHADFADTSEGCVRIQSSCSKATVRLWK